MVVWGLAGGRQGWRGGEAPGVTGGVPLVRRDSLVTRFGVVIGIYRRYLAIRIRSATGK